MTDVSDGGARLFVEGYELPDQFTLVLENVRPRECRVVWRLGHEVGCEFTDGRLLDFAGEVSRSRRKG